MQAATANLTPPFAVVDLDVLDSNTESMITRAKSATHSAGDKVHTVPRNPRPSAWAKRFQGVLAYSLPEAIWLARSGNPDVLLAYPTADRDALADLARDDQPHRRGAVSPLSADLSTFEAMRALPQRFSRVAGR